MPDIRALKRKYKGEWLAIEVTQESNGEPVKGKLILHNKDRDRIWEKIELSKDKEIYVTYAGPLVEKGYAVAFCVVSGPPRREGVCPCPDTLSAPGGCFVPQNTGCIFTRRSFSVVAVRLCSPS